MGKGRTRLIENADLESIFSEELKELRRIGGAHVNQKFVDRTLLGLLGNHRLDGLIKELRQEVAGYKGERWREIFNSAFLSDAVDDDLTTRRKAVAEKLSISERTVARMEDQIIDYASVSLANKITESPELNAKADAFVAKQQPKLQTPQGDGLPGTVKAQGVLISQMAERINELQRSLTLLSKANERLARMLEISS
jgi:hypothetical protein